MNQRNMTRTLFTAIFALVLFIAMAQANYDYTFKHVASQFHFTLPDRTPGEFTKEFKLRMNSGSVVKFEFGDHLSYAEAYFSLRPERTFEILNNGIVKNTGLATTLVFRVSNKNPESAGAQESATVYKGKYSKKVDLMRHKNAILIPLYVLMILAVIFSITFTIVFVFLFAKKLLGNNSRTNEKTSLLSAAPTQTYSVSPMMYSPQPTYPVFYGSPVASPVPNQHASMYPSSPQPNAPVEKKSQQTETNQKM